MAIDNKYGRVLLPDAHFTQIAEDEPVIVFRAKDKLLPTVLQRYIELCIEAGSPQAHVDLIRDTQEKVRAWQHENATKIPDSKGWQNR